MDTDTRIDLSSSRDVILDYAKITELHKKNLSTLIDKYKVLIDAAGNIQTDEMRKTRKELTAYFYELYKVIFFRTIDEEGNIPDEVLMFLYFGYIDEELAGKDNAMSLYLLTKSIGMDEECRIFPFYQWLRLIYMGKKIPSINEFSLDYAGYLREERKRGSITPEDEKKLYNNPVKRVEFEINNMFKSAGKMMTASVTSFCPFFSRANVYKPLDDMFLTFEKLHKTVNLIKTLDYSLFFRETVYTNPSAGYEKEFIQVEVLPDIILLPCLGERAAMWQEIEGAKRTTPARFIMPILEFEELTKTVIRLCGMFRWEMCRRVQGARWNDLSEHSLTSEYCDYIATYRKNRDLSPEAREKIKSSLVKYRNSSKEMFVHDYVEYITYESQGAIRLNRVARRTIFTYCPFCKPIRASLYLNPQFQKLVEIFDNKSKHAAHLYEIAMQRFEKAGKQIPKEISDYNAFLNM